MEREQFLSAVYIILKKNNQILLQRREGTKLYCGYLAFPAGHIDKGENAYQAVLREAKEELGIILNLENIKNTFVIQRRTKTHGPYYDIYFEFHTWEGEVKIMEPHKCSELTWYEEENLPADMIDFEKKALLYNKKGLKFACIDDIEE